MAPTGTLPLRVRSLGRVPYAVTYERMRQFTGSRDASTLDELWLLEHDPVYTLGVHADLSHLLQSTDIPVVRSDRGGQITWHGPGQLVAYLLLDLGRARIGVRDLVCRLEKGIIGLLQDLDVLAQTRPGAPGVYVDGAKIASVGLRIRQQRCYHGLALNLDPDLSAFDRINPCGYSGLPVTSLAKLKRPLSFAAAADALAEHLLDQLGARRA